MQKESAEGFALLGDKTELIHLIDRLLRDLLSQTKGLNKIKSPFDCKQIPAISILEYLRRICKYAHCSESVFVAALIYIDRYQERIQNFIINYYNIHRLLIACIMIAAKYFDDFYYKNQFYAKIGGISKKDMNALELQLVTTFDFALFVEQSQFMSYLIRLEGYRAVNA